MSTNTNPTTFAVGFLYISRLGHITLRSVTIPNLSETDIENITARLTAVYGASRAKTARNLIKELRTLDGAKVKLTQVSTQPIPLATKSIFVSDIAGTRGFITSGRPSYYRVKPSETIV